MQTGHGVAKWLLAGWLTSLGGAFAAERSVPVSPVELGRRIFLHNFGLPDEETSGKRPGMGGDGLGPQFNDFSCIGCHRDGGGGPIEKNALILSLIPPDSREPRILNPLLEEAKQWHPELSAQQVSGPLHRFGLPTAADRRPYEEHLAEIFQHLRFDPQNPAPVRGTMGRGTYEIAQRNTTALWGAGQLEELRQREGNGIRRRLMDQQNAKYPWLSGRAPRDARQNEGWFGWRGQIASLHDFNRGACATEMGLTVPGMRQHDSPVASAGGLPPQPDLDEEQVQALTAFVASLPAPQQVLPADPSAQMRVAMGEEIFNQCHCNACHVRDLGFVRGIFSDLLLHDLGPNLCDKSAAIEEILPSDVNPGAIGNSYYGPPTNLFNPPKAKPTNCECEWRTPPLWGCADTAPYLHDGRAPTLDAAILLHGGEAETSRQVYQTLTRADRSLLLAFLETLRGPGANAPAAGPPQLVHVTATVELASPPAAPRTVTSLRTPPAPAESPVNLAVVEAMEPANAEVAEPVRPELPSIPLIDLPPATFASLRTLLEELSPQATADARTGPLARQLASAQAPPGVLDYAAGLALKRGLKHQDALTAWARAAREQGPIAARARQALIREDLRTKKYAVAVAALEQHARDVAATGADWAERDRWEQFEWVGIMLGWLQGPAEIDRRGVDVAAALARVRGSLSPDDQAPLEAGLTLVARMQARLAAECDAERGVAASEQLARQTSLQERKQQLAQQEGELTQAQQSAQEQAEQKLQQLDQQLAELERQYIEREERENRLNVSILPLQARVTQILTPNQKGRSSFGMTGELGRLNAQLDFLHRQREENRTQLRITALKAQQLLYERQRLTQEHLQKSGQVQEQLQTLSKWQTRVTRQASDAAEATPDRSSRVRQLDRQLRDLATYDRFDPQAEASRLLARFRPAE